MDLVHFPAICRVRRGIRGSFLSRQSTYCTVLFCENMPSNDDST